MASYSERPVFDLEAGRIILDEDLPKVLASAGAGAVEELGWTRPNPNTLLIRMHGTFAGRSDEYILKLHFRSTREWPPSAQFVNPETLAYSYPEDMRHLPILEADHARVHPAYGYQFQEQRRSCQLICCSATWEYYETLHGGDEKLIWRPTDTFEVTLQAIGRALNSTFYKGRHPDGR